MQFIYRLCLVVSLMTTSLASYVESEQLPASARLDSLHGTMIMLIGDSQGLEMEVWAQGENVRSEISEGENKIVVIQRGDALYTFSPGKQQGQKTRFKSGLASHGLVEQIALIKSKGKLDGTQQAGGVAYDRYAYEVDDPSELALVLLEAKTSLPKDWLSIVKNGDGEHVASRTIFREMQANVEVPDSLFELPPEVRFDEVSAGELMATPLPRSLVAPLPRPPSDR